MFSYVLLLMLSSQSPVAGRTAQHSGPAARAASDAVPGGATTSEQAAPAPETKVDASRGGITVSSGVNSLTIGARAQVRWTLDRREEFDGDSTGEGKDREDGALSQFDVPRLRLSLSGGVYKPWLRYAFQFELSRTSGEGGSRIKDAMIEIRPVDRPYRIVFGQFKAPFGLQQLNSSGRLQFVDRAITDSKFTPGRDMGAMVSGRLLDQKVGYDAGVFNGSGESVRQTNESVLWTGRVFFEPWGTYTLSEGASDAGDSALLHVGAGLRAGKQIRGRTSAGIVEEPDNQTAWNVEFAYKRPRFYSTAEYFWMVDEQNNPASLDDIDSHGYHAQAGFMAVPRRLEVGVLWSAVTADTRVDDADVEELRGVLGYYWQGHNLKLQADLGRVGYDAGFAGLSARARQGLPGLGTRLVSGERLADTQVRVQLQLAF